MTRRDGEGGLHDRPSPQLNHLPAADHTDATGTEAIDLRAVLEGSTAFHHGRPLSGNPWSWREARSQYQAWELGWLEGEALDYLGVRELAYWAARRRAA